MSLLVFRVRQVKAELKTKTSELKTKTSEHAKLAAANTKLEAKLEAEKDKKVACTKCKTAKTALAKAEARIEVLQEQVADLTARQRGDQTDLAPFLSKAMEAGRPDYAGMAALLTAARPHSLEASTAPVSRQGNQGARQAGTGNQFCETCGRTRDGKTFCGVCGTRFG